MTTAGAPELAPGPIFVDTNILVYAAWPASPLHTQARSALETLTAVGSLLVISRQVLREFLATLNRPRTGLDGAELVAEVRRLEAGYLVVEDGPAVMAQLLTLIAQGARQVFDANIAATCMVAGIPQILTNNPDDFARFAPQLTTIPLIPRP